MRTAAVLIVLFMLSVRQASAAPDSKDLVKAELLADVTAAAPDKPFTLGVLLHITPGWHVYWINPGDSGLATSVKFHLPPGFTVGPLQFPVPQRLELPGNEINIGYEKEVMLLARVTPPTDPRPGQMVPIQADVRWLCCKQICLPGSAHLQLSLPIADGARPANQVLFSKWNSQVPSPHPAEVEQSKAELQPDGTALITIHWKQPPGQVQLFPGPNDAIVVNDIAVRAEANQSTITCRVTRLVGQELNAAELPVVIGYTLPDGQRRGLALSLPLSSLKVVNSK